MYKQCVFITDVKFALADILIVGVAVAVPVATLSAAAPAPATDASAVNGFCCLLLTLQ